MVCYSNSYKACCGKIIMIISVFMGLVGLITLIFGLLNTGTIPGGDKLKFIPDMSNLGLGIVFLGIIAIVIAVLGCMLRKYKNCCFATLYIVLTGIVGLICLILGFVMVGGSGLVMQATNAACKGARDAFEAEFTNAVDNVMCSATCPCDPGPQNSNKQIWTQQAGMVWAQNAGEGFQFYAECQQSLN